MSLKFSLEAMEIMAERAKTNQPFHAEEKDVDRPGFHEIWYRNGEVWKIRTEAFDQIRSIRRRVGRIEISYLTDVSVPNEDQSGGSHEQHCQAKKLP